jgi:hypothetical protein
VTVIGGSNKRVSLAALIAIKPGQQSRLIYRVHKSRRGYSSGQDIPSSQVRAVIDVKAGSRYYDGVGELLGSRWVPTVQ